MESAVFVKNYKGDMELRKSFNELAINTFGIEFEDWYKLGYWTEKYQPYSLMQNGKIVANVSVNIIQLIINNRSVQAIQIGTVMTDKQYQNRGYSRVLMEKVLKDFSHIDVMYLFANQTVLDYYPKFGFKRMNETLYSIPYSYRGKKKCIKSLDGTREEDLEFIYQFAKKRAPVSASFATSATEELLMFYALKVFTHDFYYLENLNTIVICQSEGSNLHVYDIISVGQPDLIQIIDQLAAEETTKVILHFTTDAKGVQMEKYESENVLFVRNTGNLKFPEQFKHPITSQA
ncbi:GNAT family N-acetyltransferase [Bacillus sp. S/N-304-OC-R1]|uniref:GNAT family N-acetyltransferase n=1 Tax=Bacillus sp. S/N-304-OC-R1 TaxID=2758034 RepID=UPI001C8E4731|nr:GNAT family N-acetyltransferase [Bacillus sp. S/N-304-OC-R1]MBY0122790.1 GNAT family N-acetyltransferase [Bacillus sp. S/N-304-OC-R1]